MLSFLATTIEQMDLALDQLALDDINYKRFALMLVDNVVELVVHNHAKAKHNENEMWKRFREPEHDLALVAKAMGQNFSPKIKLAVETNLFAENVGESIIILHSFRNQLYHAGMSHESILPHLASFYFNIACEVLENYSPAFIGWGSNQKIPHRAKKYLGSNPFMNAKEVFHEACKRLKNVGESMSPELVEGLSTHLKAEIDKYDEYIRFLSEDGPEKMTRDQVILDSQAWHMAFTDEGQKYAKDNRCDKNIVAEYVDWIRDNYPWKNKVDPIPSWRKRLQAIETEKDRHKALLKYNNFMSQTEDLRERINDATSSLDGYIQEQIDRMRGK